MVESLAHEMRTAHRDRQTFANLTGEGTVDLQENQRFVIATVNTANDTVNINLPPVGAVPGGIFCIVCELAANGKLLNVLAHEESALGAADGDDDTMTSISLDTTDDFAVVISTGRRWLVLSSQMA